MINFFSVGPALYYFNKHKSVLLASKYLKKSASYYNPQKQSMLGHGQANVTHHLKEIVVRYFLGLAFGTVVAGFAMPEE